MDNPYPSNVPLNIGLLNIYLVRNKVEDIVELLNEFQLDLLCITETGLFESIYWHHRGSSAKDSCFT